MAIHSVQTRLGNQINVSYHRIMFVPRIENSTMDQPITIYCAEFADIEAAKSDNLPQLNVTGYNFTISKEEIISYSGNIYALIYSKLMALPEFTGSTLI